MVMHYLCSPLLIYVPISVHALLDRQFMPNFISSIFNPIGLILMAQIIAGIGILRLKHWASRIAAWVGVFYFVGGVILIFVFTGGSSSLGTLLVGVFLLGFGIFLNIFFTRPKVKEQFE